MRWSRALLALALAILVVACGSPAATTDDDDGNGGDGSQATEPAATSGDDGGDDDGGDDDGNGGNGGDADAAFERLTPPNADEVTKTTAEGVVFGGFSSSDSVESLTSFYEDAFDDLGLVVATTTESAGAISWFVGNDQNASDFGGYVSVTPATDGGSGTFVTIQIGSTN